jgi:hypothetical protein
MFACSSERPAATVADAGSDAPEERALRDAGPELPSVDCTALLAHVADDCDPDAAECVFPYVNWGDRPRYPTAGGVIRDCAYYGGGPGYGTPMARCGQYGLVTLNRVLSHPDVVAALDLASRRSDHRVGYTDGYLARDIYIDLDRRTAPDSGTERLSIVVYRTDFGTNPAPPGIQALQCYLEDWRFVPEPRDP